MTDLPRFNPLILGFLALVCLGSSLASAAETVITPKGEAHATRFLVQWKQEDVGRSRLATGTDRAREALRRIPDLQAIRSFAQVPGLAVLEMEKPAHSRRRSSATLSSAEEHRRQEEALQASGLFAWVEPDYVVRLSSAPLDAAYADGRLWGLRNTGQSGGSAGADINALAAWSISTGSPRVVLAVIDTGLRLTHRDLAANLWRNPGEVPGNGLDDDGNGYIDDYHGINTLNRLSSPGDDHGHGSHVAGTIAATANNDGPHVGVAWEAGLMALKFLDADGSGFISGAVECIDYAIARGAQIINASWGTSAFSSSLELAVARAAQAGVLFVAAAGNNSRDADSAPIYPSGYRQPNIVSVAAIDRRDQLAWFSNYGAQSVHLAAPGTEIFSCTHETDDSYKIYNGTSMATPHVAGVAALVLARFPAITLPELRQRLLQTATPVPALAGRTLSGGRVNAAAALNAAEDGILELSARPEVSPLRAGLPVRVFATVSDLLPLRGAQVEARFGGGPSAALLDNGIWPDTASGDGVYAGQLVVPTGGSTVRLVVSASAPGKVPASAEFFFPVVSRPPNDDFAARTVTGGGITRSFGTNLNATLEAGETSRPSTAGGQTVWWRWTAPADGPVTISTAGSDFDTTLAIYRGTTLDALELVGENDDSGGLTSLVTFEAEKDAVYAIQVDGYRGSAGQIVLNHPVSAGSAGPPVIIEEPFDLSVLVGRPFTLAVRAFGAGTYQWFRDGRPLGGETNAEITRPSATEQDGGTYRVAVGNAFGTVTSRDVRVQVERTALRPENDNLGQARSLAPILGRVFASTEVATGESGEPNHAGASLPLASVWWSWTAPSDGTLTLQTSGSNFDTTLAVYRGTSVASLVEVASNDDAVSSQSRIVMPVVARSTYWIAVDGRGDARGSVVLEHEFSAGQTPGKVNDFFADRLPFEGLAVTGSNVGASGEPGEPDHAGTSAPLASVWWTWTAPADGRVRFNTLGSSFDTTLAVYTGEKVGELQQVAANDNIFGVLSGVILPVRAGVAYSIAVDGKESATGEIRLNGRFIPDAPVYEPGPPISAPAKKARTVILTVKAAGAWQAETTADWISVRPASGFGLGRLRVSIRANPGEAPREGFVRVAGVEYAVRQPGNPAVLAGSYRGAIGDLGLTEAAEDGGSLADGFTTLHGSLVLSVTPSGAYSGSLTTAQARFTGSGRLAEDGSLDGTWRDGTETAALRLQPGGERFRRFAGEAVINGVTHDALVAPLIKSKALVSKATLTLRPVYAASGASDEDLRTTVRPTGRAMRLAVSLPDGRRFQGRLPATSLDGAENLAFAWLRSGDYRLAGWLHRRGGSADASWTGRWELITVRNSSRIVFDASLATD